MKFLLTAREKLDNIRYGRDKFSNSLPCLIGWRNNVAHLLSLFTHLEVCFDVNNLTLHNCTQDSVENFFSRISAGGGNRDNPSANEFLAEYRKVAVDSLFCKVRGSNCSLDAGELLLKLDQVQRESENPALINLPDVTPIPIDLSVSSIRDNTIILICLDICTYISRLYCNSCIYLVCTDVSSSFDSNLILLMDLSKNSTNRKCPTTLFYEYVHKLYILFNHYQNDIIYVSNICKLFIKIVCVNNVLFNYCGTCHINDAVICYFIKRRLNIVLSLENCDTIFKNSKNGIRKSRKLLKLKHL